MCLSHHSPFYVPICLPESLLCVGLLLQFARLVLCAGRYVRVLGAFYLRLVGTPADIYQYLEPLYNDYRKIRIRLTQGTLITDLRDKVRFTFSHQTLLRHGAGDQGEELNLYGGGGSIG